MKHLAIKKYYTSFSIDSVEIENNVSSEQIESLDKELDELFKKYNMTLLEHDTRFIPIEKMSLSYCEKCNHLMINRDKNPTKFDGDEFYSDLGFIILNGGTDNGMDLCEECLPISHRWGHFS